MNVLSNLIHDIRSHSAVIKIRSLFILSLLALYACADNTTNNAETQAHKNNNDKMTSVLPVPADTIAIVNGEPISSIMLNLYTQEKKKENENSPSNIKSKDIIQELINVYLVMQAAKSQGLDQRKDIKDKLQFSTNRTLTKAALQEYLNQNPVQEIDIQTTYQQLVKMNPKIEYKARHILLETQKQAMSIIKQLGKNGNFIQLAKKHSIGPSASNGGDLGWFTPDNMVKPFADAAQSLTKGFYTNQPIKTKFGWHVILLEDNRNISPPTLNQVKKDIVALIQKQKVEKYIQQLRQSAKVDVLHQ